MDERAEKAASYSIVWGGVVLYERAAPEKKSKDALQGCSARSFCKDVIVWLCLAWLRCVLLCFCVCCSWLCFALPAWKGGPTLAALLGWAVLGSSTLCPRPMVMASLAALSA